MIAPYRALSSLVFFEFKPMGKVSYDFKIIGHSGMPSVSLIEAQNEEALNFIKDEECLAMLPDGCAPIMNQSVEEFILDASNAHLSCALV